MTFRFQCTLLSLIIVKDGINVQAGWISKFNNCAELNKCAGSHRGSSWEYREVMEMACSLRSESEFERGFQSEQENHMNLSKSGCLVYNAYLTRTAVSGTLSKPL